MVLGWLRANILIPKVELKIFFLPFKLVGHYIDNTISLRFIKAKSRFNIGSCRWNAHKGRKRVRRGKIFICSLSLSGWITSWHQRRGLGFSSSLCLRKQSSCFVLFCLSAKSITSISGSNKDRSTGKRWIFYRCKLPWEDSHQTFSLYGATECCFPEAIFWHSFSSEPPWVQIPAQSLPCYVNLGKLCKNFVPQLPHL